MENDTRVVGYVPGGEDRVQWIFEDDGWYPEVVAYLVDMLTPYVHAYRQRYGFDLVCYYTFSYHEVGGHQRMYRVSRRNWEYGLYAQGEIALYAKMKELLVFPPL